MDKLTRPPLHHGRSTAATHTDLVVSDGDLIRMVFEELNREVVH